MNEVSLDITLTPKQQEIFEAFFNGNDTWIVSVGGKGSAKSTVSTYIVLLLLLSDEYKNSKILVARENLRDLKNTIISSLNKEITKLGLEKDVIYQNDALQYIQNKATGTTLYYLSLSDKNDQYRSVLSYEFNVAIIDEADRISEEAFTEVSMRLRHKHKLIRGMLNLNPTNEEHWIYKKFIKEKFPSSVVIHSTTYDNYLIKKMHISEFSRLTKFEINGKVFYTYKQDRFEFLRREGNYMIVKHFNLPHAFLYTIETSPYPYRRVMLEGNWGNISLDNGVYSDIFTEDNILTKPLSVNDTYFWRFYAGIDFGFTHPAFVLIGEDEYGRLIVIDEILGDKVSSIDFIGHIQNRLREKWRLSLEDVEFFGDVAGSFREQSDGMSIIRKIEDKWGIHIKTGRVKQNESVSIVRDLLQEEKASYKTLRVHSDCKLIIEGFMGGFKWDKDGTRLLKDGFYEHLHDALRYVLYHISFQIKRKKVSIVTPDY